MYKIGELKYKDNVSYAEMMTVALQYAKNAKNGMANDGFVVHDFAYVCAVLYAFTEMSEAQLAADEVMLAVYSEGFDKYIDEIRNRTPMGKGFFDGFIGMLNRIDASMERYQPIDTLIDGLIKATNGMSAFMTPGKDGVSGMGAMINMLREFAANGEATPAQ